MIIRIEIRSIILSEIGLDPNVPVGASEAFGGDFSVGLNKFAFYF